MPEGQTIAGALGIKYGGAVAGFYGTLLYLAHTEELSRKQMLLALFTGIACSIWLPPLVSAYLGLPEPVENALAFLIGLTGMSLIAGILRAGDKFKDNPLGFFHKGDTK